MGLKRSRNPICRAGWLAILFLCAATCLCHSQANLHSSDGYVRREGNEWVLGTSKVERRIRLANGRFVLASLRNKTTGHEYQDGTNPPAEIRFVADGQDVSSPDWAWKLRNEHAARGDLGELQLDVALESAALRVTKHYVVYPGTAVIREWLTLENSSAKAIRISQLDFLHTRVMGSMAQDLQLNYLTGGGNYNGSQLLKTEPIHQDYERTFDSKGGPQTLSYSAFLPLVFMLNRSTSEGVAVGWDYLGHWRFEIGNQDGEPLGMQIEVAGYAKDLAPGAQIETPKAFMATFSGGVDELGNQLLDWQYAYFWEFTNPDYFAKTRWAVDWPDPWVGDGGTPSADNWGRRLALDLRYVDLLSETGTDILWDDAGWYDKWGTWNAPDWRLTNDYLRKHDMRWVLWYPTFLGTQESKVGQLHPDWLIPGQDVLEQSIPGTVDWQTKLLDDSVKDWGEYQWRYDIAPAVSGNDTDYLESDQNFRKLLERFKKDHPQSGIDACYGGGRWISYDIARLAESGEYTDGGVGPYSVYYTSLMLPPDKLHNVVDYDNIYYRPEDRIHLMMNPTWYRDPGDGPNLESIRKDWEIYHYLSAQGVVGRWGHVFRPQVEHDDPIWYFQRMNRDGSKGVILAKHAKHGATYFITSRLSKREGEGNDRYHGDSGNMNLLTTTAAATIETGIYEDPVDSAPRFYGVPGQAYGPLNLKYQAGTNDQSLVTKIASLGAGRHVTTQFFGMVIQLEQPLTVTELGQFDPGNDSGEFGANNNRGIYTISVVRSQDGSVLATADLDMGHAKPDAMGFKYVRLTQPIQLSDDSKPVVIHPRGLLAAQTYDVTAIVPGVHLRETGSKLMAEGITLDRVAAGELIFLNLPNYPGSGTDHIPPTAPSNVSKRLGSNLGVQGIEVSWSPSQDNNWISYYEVHKDGKLAGKVGKGTFYFDHSDSARADLDKSFEVIAVDGDGNRSPATAAKASADSEPPSYEALGDFSPAQSAKQWAYEEMLPNGSYENLVWDKGGYEGRWAGSGMGLIGRIWMQPSAQYDLSRTFIVPVAGMVSTSGGIRKDPNAENQASCFVRIVLNSQRVWPQEGWAEVHPNFDAVTNYQISNLRVAAGDKLRFIVKHNDANRADPIEWNPRVVIAKP